MILRKPYKFLIKNFKLIHLIMTILMVYIIYRFSRIVNFFDVATSSYVGVLSTNPTASLFDLYIYLAIFFVIVFCLIVIFLLYMKKKSIKLYISTIIIYIVAFVLIAYSYNVVGDMEVKIVDPKILRNARDFLIVGGIAQVVEIILFGIRALGLDIKNFNFKDDLKEFDIVAEDNEEFEFNVNVDVNKVQRHVNKGKRFLRYFYVENKYLFFFISSLCICFLCLIFYLSLGVYNKKYTQTDFFTTKDYTMAISNSYITNLDYKFNKISENKTFVILEIIIKTNGKNPKELNLARPELIVGFNKYHHDIDYYDEFVDIGNAYNYEQIDNNFIKYLLVYPIDKNDVNKKMTFRYIDDNSITSTEAKSINVSITARNLDEIKDTKKYKLGDTIDFSDSILGKTKLTINNEEISSIFKLNYNFCVVENECYKSIEYLKPSVINNYDKTLIKFNGKIDWDLETARTKTTDLFKFMSLYGKFKYKIDDTEKNDITVLKNVKSVRVNEEDTYYIEAIKEIENASQLQIEFRIRDYIYIYKLF